MGSISQYVLKRNGGTLLDVVITNVPKRFKNTDIIDVGLSDIHNMVCFATKIYVPVKRKRTILYRRFEHFNEENYIEDLSKIPYHVCEIFDSAYDSFWLYNELLKEVVDSRASLNKRVNSTVYE